MIYPRTYTAWDLETTGLSPTENKILEIGVIKVVDAKEVVKKSWLLNHKIEIPEKITEITGITKEIVDKEGVDPVGALKEFLEILGTTPANITHNGYKFDIPFLVNAVPDRPKLKAFLEAGCVDTAVMYKARKMRMDRMWNENFIDFAKRIMDIKAYGVKFNLALCCTELRVDTTKITAHRALGDVKMTNEVYKKLVTG